MNNNFYNQIEVFHYSISDLNYMFYYLHLQLHEICFIDVLASYILAIILNNSTFQTVLLGTHIFLYSHQQRYNIH